MDSNLSRFFSLRRIKGFIQEALVWVVSLSITRRFSPRGDNVGQQFFDQVRQSTLSLRSDFGLPLTCEWLKSSKHVCRPIPLVLWSYRRGLPAPLGEAHELPHSAESTCRPHTLGDTEGHKVFYRYLRLLPCDRPRQHLAVVEGTILSFAGLKFTFLRSVDGLRRHGCDNIQLDHFSSEHA